MLKTFSDTAENPSIHPFIQTAYVLGVMGKLQVGGRIHYLGCHSFTGLTQRQKTVQTDIHIYGNLEYPVDLIWEPECPEGTHTGTRRTFKLHTKKAN